MHAQLSTMQQQHEIFLKNIFHTFVWKKRTEKNISVISIRDSTPENLNRNKCQLTSFDAVIRFQQLTYSGT